MVGYPRHENSDHCHGLLMTPAEAGFAASDRLVFCTICSPKQGLIKVDVSKENLVWDNATVAGIRQRYKQRTELAIGDLPKAERVALDLVMRGMPPRKTHIARLERRGLVVAGELTAAGARLVIDAGWRAPHRVTMLAAIDGGRTS